MDEDKQEIEINWNNPNSFIISAISAYFSLIPKPENEKIETKIQCFCHNNCPGKHGLE